jgi:hypothetical protein
MVSTGPESENVDNAPGIEASENRVPCPICHEPIILGARKCVKCNSDLYGWRSYISLSTTTLALLTALISVVGSTAPTIWSLFLPSDARLHPVFIGGADSPPYREEVLLITNDGTKSGALTAARLRADWRLNGHAHRVEFVLLLPKGRPVIVPPGENVDAVLTIDPDLFDLQTDTSNADAQAFAVTAKQAKWKEEPLNSMTCIVFADFVYSAGTQLKADIPTRCESILLAMVNAFEKHGSTQSSK